MTFSRKLTGGLVALALVSNAGMVQAASHSDGITVAYFLEWPMPFEYAKQKGTYEEEMGVPVNWVSFDTGTAMSAAMASGDVQLAVSQGVPPFVVATSAGQDLQILDVAVSYSENDNCVVREELEIDKDSAGELAGKKVAVPLGTAAHYGFLKQMNHFGVDVSGMEVVDMAPPDGAAAIAQGSVDMAWLGRRAASHEGARQRTLDRRREGGTGHPGVRCHLRPRFVGGREQRPGRQVSQGDRGRQCHVGG